MPPQNAHPQPHLDHQGVGHQVFQGGAHGGGKHGAARLGLLHPREGSSGVRQGGLGSVLPSVSCRATLRPFTEWTQSSSIRPASRRPCNRERLGLQRTLPTALLSGRE